MRSLHSRQRSSSLLQSGLFCHVAVGISALSLCAASPHAASAQILSEPVAKICVSDLRYRPLEAVPLVVQLSWHIAAVPGPPTTNPDSDPSAPTTVGGGTAWTYLNRSPGGANDISGATYVIEPNNSNPAIYIQTYQDTTCGLNTRYEYYLTGNNITWNWMPGNGNNPGQWYSTTTPVRSASAFVTAEKASVSANQTVDTRIDPRFDIPPMKNYPFGDTQFRGGLFVGYNADSAQVARTYLKFSSLAGPVSSGESLWPVGGMMIYSTRTAKTGAASILCRSATSSTWDPATLTWGNAPALTGEDGVTAAVSWDRTNPLEQWMQFDCTGDIGGAIGATPSDLTLVLQSASESGSGTATTANTGWAYFARNTYVEPAAPPTPSGGTPLPAPPSPSMFNPGDNHGRNLSAYLFYAFGGSATDAVHCIQFSPNTVNGAGYSTGIVYLLTPPTGANLVLSLSCNDSHVTLPATVTLAPYATSASFPVSTTATGLTTSKTVTIRASGSNYDLYGTLTLAPPSSGGGG